MFTHARWTRRFREREKRSNTLRLGRMAARHNARRGTPMQRKRTGSSAIVFFPARSHLTIQQ